MELGKRVLTDSFESLVAHNGGSLKRLAESSNYEMSDTELGEPSADCNCVTLSEVYEELLDMKAMIGRLIRNGEES